MNGLCDIGNMLKKIRMLRGYSRKKVALMLSISEKTIERIENGENAQFNTMLDLFKLYKVTEKDLVSLFMDANDTGDINVITSEDPMLVRRRRMSMFENMSYYGYYLMDSNNGPCFVECMELKFGEFDVYSRLNGQGVINDNEYECHIIVNVDELYAYMVFEGKNIIHTRIMIVLPLYSYNKSRYILGVGYMLTITSDYSAKVCFQKVMLLATDMPQPTVTSFMDLYKEYLSLHDGISDECKTLVIKEDIKELNERLNRDRRLLDNNGF